MSDLTIKFSNPWLLFLIIPAILLTLIPFFRLPKKYRKTRNRITAMVLNLVIVLLSVSLLSGITFAYNKTNLDNEVIVLVDTTYSGQEQRTQKDDFVRSIIRDSGKNFKVGVVKFGFNQVYAAPLSTDSDKVYNNYIYSEEPDGSATDIASALQYAATLFSTPQSAKIVLLSDGFETDRQAATVIRAISAEGIKVDTVRFPSEVNGVEMQLIGIEEPENKIKIGEPFNLGVKIQSSGAAEVTVRLRDIGSGEDEVIASRSVAVTEGTQSVGFSTVLEQPGMHCLAFDIIASSGSDQIEFNNLYNTYYLLNMFNELLVIERTVDESKRFVDIVGSSYQVTVVNVNDSEEMPSNLNELRQFDQVVLFNIANSDLPPGFDEILHSYVYDIGGGVFTVGGNKIDSSGNEVANTYVESDMNDTDIGTAYQRMLPVQSVEYTPPLAVAIIIDRSGSMSGSPLAQAKKGALSCLDALEDQDYCGIYTLDDDYSEIMPVTPYSRKAEIIAAIESINGTGNTVFSGALNRAGIALNAEKNVAKRHIILVTDGQPTANDDYMRVVQRNFNEYEITMSVVLIGRDFAAWDKMKLAVDAAGGNIYPATRDTELNTADLPRIMREDLNIPAITGIKEGEFTPVINGDYSATQGIDQKDMPVLTGYYGTRLKAGAKAPLMGPFVPIYAEWDYGKGTVGSFMCDLNGKWSEAFLNSAAGHTFLFNVVDSLFPTEDIRKKEIEVSMTEDNYRTQMSIYTTLAYDDRLEVTITSPRDANGNLPKVQTFTLTPQEGFSRLTFENKLSGLYTIVIKRYNADNKETASLETYKMFSYSKEYNGFNDDAVGAAMMEMLAVEGNGSQITQSWEAFEGFVRFYPQVYDPRIPFLIVIIVLFLLEIAARKFKFKWIHEIVRERKQRAMVNGR